MGTEISTDRLKAAGIVNFASSLSPQDRSEHLAFIGVRVEALLEPYWDKRPSDLVKAEIIMDWMEALQGFSPDEIRTACRDYLKGPDCRAKPKPGDIRRLIEAARAARLAALPKPPEPGPEIRKPPPDIRASQAEALLKQFKRMENP